MSMAMEEPECLMQTDSICRKLDIAAALRESVSFGRFVTEPLEWGKWSSFNQNKYLEEAERYSTRGSVAEKKALFEAHYKRIAAKKAAELLEQATAVAEEGDDYYGDGNAESSFNEAEYTTSWHTGAVAEDDGHAGAATEIEPEDGFKWVYGETYSGSVSHGDTEKRISESDPCEIEADNSLKVASVDSGRCNETSQANTTTPHWLAVEERCDLVGHLGLDVSSSGISESDHCGVDAGKESEILPGDDDRCRETSQASAPTSSWFAVDGRCDLGHRLGLDVSNAEQRVSGSDHCEIKADELTETPRGNLCVPCRETSPESTPTTSNRLPMKERRDLSRLELDDAPSRSSNSVGRRSQSQSRLGIDDEASQVQKDSDKIHNSFPEMEQTKPMPIFEPSPLQENSNKHIPASDNNDSSRTPLTKCSVPTIIPPISTPLSAKHPIITASHGKENNPTPGSSRTKSRKRVNDKAVPLPVNQSPQHKSKASSTPDVTVPPKPEKTWSPKVVFGCFGSCQDLGRARGTPRKVSTKETMSKVDAGQGLNARSKTPSGKSTCQSTRKADGRWQSLIVNRGKPSSCTSTPDNSQLASSSCLNQSEDRAEKRKEYFQKLEEKLNAEKVERQLKEKEKAENELKSLRQNLCFKARPLPGFYERTKQSRQI